MVQPAEEVSRPAVISCTRSQPARTASTLTLKIARQKLSLSMRFVWQQRSNLLVSFGFRAFRKNSECMPLFSISAAYARTGEKKVNWKAAPYDLWETTISFHFYLIDVCEGNLYAGVQTKHSHARKCGKNSNCERHLEIEGIPSRRKILEKSLEILDRLGRPNISLTEPYRERIPA